MFLIFFKQKTAYEWRISDWSSDVCSSDLADDGLGQRSAQGSQAIAGVLADRFIGHRGTGVGQVLDALARRSPLLREPAVGIEVPLGSQRVDRSAPIDRKSTRLNSSH